MFSRIRHSFPQVRISYFSTRLLALGPPRAGRSKKPLPLSSEVYHRPNEFVPLYTKYGWFVISKDYNIVDWTQDQLDPLLQAKIAELDLPLTTPPLPSEARHAIQSVIDAWVAEARLPKKPKIKKSAAGTSEDLNDYLAVLHLNITNELTGMISGTKIEKPLPKLEFKIPENNVKLYPEVGIVKAWNYFQLKTSPTIKVVPEGSTRRTMLAETWKRFSQLDKEKYRLEYGKLLESGYDISGGKIIEKGSKRKPKKSTKDATK